jgi:hypothetical protein
LGWIEEEAMISIGAVYHGPELQGSEINRLVISASKALKELRGPLRTGETPWVNAVFVVSGSLDDVDFDGLEYGEYSKKDKGVVVKIAVPKSVLEAGGLPQFVIDGLHGANAMAFEFFRLRGESFPLREAEVWVKEIAKSAVGSISEA